MLVFKSGEYVFGAYSPVIIPDDGEYSGTEDAFLFSLTHNLIFPYHGRRHHPKWKGRRGGDAVRGEEDMIQYGLKDLVIPEDMLRCSSSLEHSYGFGMANDVTNTFLAGQQIFTIDEVEIWRVGRAFEAALAEPFEEAVSEAGSYSDGESHSSFDSFDSGFSAGTFSTSTGYTDSKKGSVQSRNTSGNEYKPQGHMKKHHSSPIDTKEQKAANKRRLHRSGTNSLSMARIAVDKDESIKRKATKGTDKSRPPPPRFSVLERQLLESMKAAEQMTPPAPTESPSKNLPPPPRFSSIFKTPPGPPSMAPPPNAPPSHAPPRQGFAPPPPSHAPPPGVAPPQQGFAPPPPAHAPPLTKKETQVPSLFTSLPVPPPAPVLVGSKKGQVGISNQLFDTSLRSSLNASISRPPPPAPQGLPPPPPPGSR